MYMESCHRIQIHMQCFLTSDGYRIVHLLSIEKRNTKKRLSQEQDKDDAGQQPEVTETVVTPPVMEGPGLPLEVPLIQPKTEPEEQESKWTNSYKMMFTFSSFL